MVHRHDELRRPAFAAHLLADELVSAPHKNSWAMIA
jgi:hypothetical protein